MPVLADILRDKQVVVCVGAGGVGAMIGKKTLVCTIDPARRLANSLGLPFLGNRPVKIDPSLFQKAGIEIQGELYGMMADTKRTFDELIERIAPSREVRDAILENRYYQSFSSALAGSQEYMATEKMYEIHHEGNYDVVVLDTPPTKHALDFLDAPRRLTDFLDGKVVQWFIKPYMLAGKLGFKFAIPSATLIFRILSRFTGYEVLADLTEFFLAFEGLYGEFKKRAAAVKDLLADESVTSFVLVSTPSPPALDETAFFRDRLTAFGMPLGGICINRVISDPWPSDRADLERRLLAAVNEMKAKSPKLAEEADALARNLIDLCRLSDADAQAIRKFSSALEKEPVFATVPLFTSDVHDLSGLAEVARYLMQS